MSEKSEWTVSAHIDFDFTVECHTEEEAWALAEAASFNVNSPDELDGYSFGSIEIESIN